MLYGRCRVHSRMSVTHEGSVCQSWGRAHTYCVASTGHGNIASSRQACTRNKVRDMGGVARAAAEAATAAAHGAEVGDDVWMMSECCHVAPSPAADMVYTTDATAACLVRDTICLYMRHDTCDSHQTSTSVHMCVRRSDRSVHIPSVCCHHHIVATTTAASHRHCDDPTRREGG